VLKPFSLREKVSRDATDEGLMVARERGAVELYLVMLRTSSACCAGTFSFKEKEGRSL
jgi:hypothetical protein